MKQAIFSFLLLFASNLYSQSLTGTNGLFKTPSAHIGVDGYSYAGLSILPKGYYDYLFKGDVYTGMPTFVTLSFYNRVEVMFRYTHQLGHEVSEITRYFPDRMFSLRYNLLKEQGDLPAITIGLHDVTEVFGTTTAQAWFMSTYLVATKDLSIGPVNLSTSFGYAPVLTRQTLPNEFEGFFGGIELSSKNYPNFKFVAEYDSQYFNIALKALTFKHLHLALGLIDLKGISGLMVYSFKL